MSDDFQALVAEAQDSAVPRIPSRRRWAAKAAGYFPPRLRFSLFGIPGGRAGEADWKRQRIASPFYPEAKILATIERGMACHFGAHLTGAGLIIPELSPEPVSGIVRHFLRHQHIRPDITRRAGALISLVQPGHDDFFHWMYEVLPRWQIVKASLLRQTGGVYACMRSRFHAESLALLGLVPARAVDSASELFLQADTLFVPDWVSYDEPWIIPWLRDALLGPALKHSSVHTRKRIYVTGKTARPGCEVVNESAWRALLKKYDFTEIFLEDYSLSGQIALFHEAQAIVAVNDPVLALLAFCEGGARVLEVGVAASRSPFQAIAETRGLSYRFLAAAGDGKGRLSIDLEAAAGLLEL